MTRIDPAREQRNRELRERMADLPPREYARLRDALLKGRPLPQSPKPKESKP